VQQVLQIEIDENLNPDLKKLAFAVLSGDASAINPMVDCYIENMKEGPRITPDYVETLEDCLHNIGNMLLKARDRGDDPYNNDARLYDYEVGLIYKDLFNLERYARTLGRMGLS
jgi:hypothetical protein